MLVRARQKLLALTSTGGLAMHVAVGPQIAPFGR